MYELSKLLSSRKNKTERLFCFEVRDIIQSSDDDCGMSFVSKRGEVD